MKFVSVSAAFAAVLLLSGNGPATAAAFDVRTFSPGSGYAIPNGEWRVLDFNGDGRKDVVHIVNASDYVHTWASNGDGTFTVGTFRPWQGYAMPNGLWLVADLNGDGREDMVHAVQNSDYVHTWMSNGDGSFAVGTFRPWAGYAIPNGEWRTLDFDGDGRTDIVHITGGGYAHTWRSNGDGTFAVGTFLPWQGYKTPNGLWLTGDINGDGRGDLIHAVQNSDYVHTWTSNGDGSFAVGTFRPWAGYAIPNGEWRTLDFDGDGRTDIVHITGGGYAHTWRSNGDGSFAVGTFQPWPGYATPNGLWLTGDFDADGKGDLLHAVANSSWAHPWLSNGDGSFRVGTFQPWPGYAVPNGLWLAGDLSGDRKTDVLHAVANSSYTHPWLSTLPRPGEFGLDGLEITQAIQDIPHSVPLVAAKPTVVRVYPMFNGSGSRQVRGRLWVRNTAGAPWQLLTSQNVATVDPAENGNLRLKRENANRGLTFAVPPAALSGGTFVAWMQDLTDAATGAALACADCAVTNRAMPLGDANPMRVRVLGLSYRAGTPAQTLAPRPLDFTLTRSWLGRAYPTGDLRMTTGTVAANATPPFSCNDANAQLTAIRNADIAGGTDRRTHYYGLVFENGAPGFFMRGCAAGIPSSPSPGTVASGPTGPGAFGWDTDGSYGDWYTGHELGHTYGRLHIGSGCGETADDPNYPFTDGRISAEDGAFVGFDTGDAGNGIAARALPGRDWSDVMSYCANQWISAYTYRAIAGRLAAENALPAGPEPLVAGAAMAEPTPAAMAGPPAIVDGASPPLTAVVTALVAPAQAAPNAIAAAGPAPAEPPAPAMARPPAIEVAQQQPPAEASEADVPPMGDATAGRPLPGTATGAAAGEVSPPAEPVATAERSLQEGDFLAVVASVNLTRGTATIVDARRVAQGLVPAGDPGGTLVLRGLGADGSELGRWNVPFLPNSEREAGDDLAGVMDAVVPFPAGLTTVEVLVGDKAVASFSAPAAGAVPAIESIRGAAAGVRVTPAGDGAVTVGFAGIGEAPAGASYEVQASGDGGDSWTTVAIGLTEPEAQVDLGGLGAEGPVELRVILKDGFEQRILDTVEVPAGR